MFCKGDSMIRSRKSVFHTIALFAFLSFLLTSCSGLPLIGKKTKTSEVSDGKTVSMDQLENIKGVNPPKQDAPAAQKKPSSPPPAPSLPPKSPQTVSAPPSRAPSYSLPMSFFQAGLKKKLVVLDFENKTTYQEEKIGEAVAKRLSDKLDATQRLIITDKTVLSERLEKQGIRGEKVTSPVVMKNASRSFGIQAFVAGTVADVSILSSKASDTSDEEVSFATARVEIQLIDASTGNLLKTFIGRSPIFGTKETGENSRGRAVNKAIDSCLDEILEGFLRQADLLDWSTTIAKVEGENLYINAGKLSGIRIGDALEVFEPGKEIVHPTTNFSLGWTTGKLKGTLRVMELFGVDGAAGKIIQGQNFGVDDVVKSAAR